MPDKTKELIRTMISSVCLAVIFISEIFMMEVVGYKGGAPNALILWGGFLVGCIAAVIIGLVIGPELSKKCGNKLFVISVCASIIIVAAVLILESRFQPFDEFIALINS